MTTRMRTLVGVGMASTMAVLVASVTPAQAARVTHESYTFSGTMAEAKWFSESDPAPGEPRVAAVMGADALTVHRVPGAAPERTSQPAVLAMAAEDEAGPLELWCVSDVFAFTVAKDLSTAALSMSCLAEWYTIDPVTGEEVPTGETMPLTVEASWTAIGPLELQKSHTRYAVGGAWTMDVTRASLRPAVAELLVTGPDGVVLDEQATEATIQQVRSASLIHE